MIPKIRQTFITLIFFHEWKTRGLWAKPPDGFITCWGAFIQGKNNQKKKLYKLSNRSGRVSKKQWIKIYQRLGNSSFYSGNFLLTIFGGFQTIWADSKMFKIVNWRLFLVIVSSDWPWYIFLPRCVSNITHLSLLKIDLGHNLPLLSVAFKRPRVEIASPFFFTNSFLQQPKSRHLGDISNLREERSSALPSSGVSFKGHLDFC